jgi:hypothetical protein
MTIGNKKIKVGIFVVVVLLLAVNIFITTAEAKSIKQITCEAVGCPNGSRACADVGKAPLIYYCYENPPQI